MASRQPKITLPFRIIAAGCVVFWLAGVSACNLESLVCCEFHGKEEVALADKPHSHREHDAHDQAHRVHAAAAPHSHGAQGHSQGSHKHESKEYSCCSTLTAVVQTAQATVFGKSAFQPGPALSALLEMRAPALVVSKNPPYRQSNRRDWVFTPVVCLGPAHRSLAETPRESSLGT